jgi:hypothetical protein
MRLNGNEPNHALLYQNQVAIELRFTILQIIYIELTHYHLSSTLDFGGDLIFADFF